MLSNNNNRRYTVPSTSFVDPAIVRLVDKSQHTLPEQQLLDRYDDEEDTTSSMTSSPLMTQRLSPPQPTASTSLDHLWSKQERYDDLQLRILSLEESERRFEQRLESLEKEKKSHHLLTLQRQPMKPDQSTDTNDDAHDDNKNYIQLYNALLEKYNALQQEFKKKEKQYEDKIQELLKTQKKEQVVAAEQQQQQQKPCYREEDGYLLFDTTNMNGEIMHCKVKIPSNNTRQYYHQPVKRGQFITTTLTKRVVVPPQQQQQYHRRHITSPKTALNPNAPEWKKKDRRI